MSIKVLAGELYNVLGTGDVTVSSEDADFVAENLTDGRSDLLFKFSAPGTSDTITVDGTRIENGSLDTWVGGNPSDWTVSGTVAQSTSIARTGSSARLLGSGATVNRIHQDFRARAGERIVLESYLAVTNPGASLIFNLLQNLDTGKYFNSGTTTWANALDVWASFTASTSFTVVGPKPIEVESFEAIGKDTCTLRMTFFVAAATSDFMYVDDSHAWSSVNHGSIHGHNIRQDVAAKFESSPDNFSTSSSGSTFLQATMTKAQPAFYTALSSAVDHRYWRFRFLYTALSTLFDAPPTEAVHIGEAVIGYAQELERGFNYGSQVTHVQDTVVGRNQFGSQIQAFKYGQRPRRVIDMEFDYFSESEYLDGREFWERAAGNSSPVVVVPDTSEDIVVLGNLEPVFSVTRSLTEHYTGSQVRVTESPFAVVTT